jgi:hypothetical protein
MRLTESWAQKVQVFALFVLIGIPGPAFCGERHICKTLAVTRPTRSQVIELQKLVNNGHEPWWLDANAVAAQEVLKRENTAKEHYDVYGVPLTELRKTTQSALLEYSTGSKSYRIRLYRPKWLLTISNEWKNTIWLVDAIEECKRVRSE